MIKFEIFRIYGPPILRECIDEQKPLPLWNHPVFSSVFEGAKLTLTSFEPEKKASFRLSVLQHHLN